MLWPAIGAGASFMLAWVLFPAAVGSGVAYTKAALYISDGYVPFSGVIGKFVASTLSIGSGNPMGPEQAVLLLMQQLGHQRMAHLMPAAAQFFGQPAHALAGPAQRRLRVATRARLHQLFQIPQQGRILGLSLLAAPAWTANGDLATRPLLGRLLELRQTRADGASRHAACTRHQRDPSASQRGAFRRRPQAPHTLVEPRLELPEALSYLALAGHSTILGRKCFKCYGYLLTDP